jgi:hypothetical protein
VQSLQERERSRRPLGSLNRLAPAQAGASFVSTRIFKMVRDFLAGVGGIRNERQQAIVGQDAHSRRAEPVKRIRNHTFDGTKIRINARPLTSSADGFVSIGGTPSPACDRPPTNPGPFSVTPSAGTPRNAPLTARQSPVLPVSPDHCLRCRTRSGYASRYFRSRGGHTRTDDPRLEPLEQGHYSMPLRQVYFMRTPRKMQ